MKMNKNKGKALAKSIIWFMLLVNMIFEKTGDSEIGNTIFSLCIFIILAIMFVDNMGELFA